jgi:hypothetical protein
VREEQPCWVKSSVVVCFAGRLLKRETLEGSDGPIYVYAYSVPSSSIVFSIVVFWVTEAVGGVLPLPEAVFQT